jgi:hypothetical protein
MSDTRTLDEIVNDTVAKIQADYLAPTGEAGKGLERQILPIRLRRSRRSGGYKSCRRQRATCSLNRAA